METEASHPIEKKPKKQALVKQNFDSSPESLIALAVDKDFDIDKLQKLIDMKNANDAKVAKMEFLNALSKFQGILPPLVKNKTADFGEGKAKYQYHQLPDIEKHIRPFLKDCGLSYRWSQKEEGNVISVRLILAHIGGHEEQGEPISGGLDTSGAKSIIQQKASTISYLRRYTLTGGLGISSADKDNDGKDGLKDGDLPKLKDNQIGAIITRIHKGEMTWEQLDTKCVYTPDQRKTIEEGLEKMKSGK